MQQYDKYIGDYITKSDVDTTDWGALMLSVLESVDASDFSKAADYKKYVNKVDALADAYEEATTVGMVETAEQGMYDLLTTSVSNTSGSKTDLAATINSLYFNVKTAPATYETAWKTAGNAQYVNFTYYYATRVGEDGNGAAHYSLYPQADYAETGNSITVYTGNKGEYTGTATDEYEWFLNVYELAAAMKNTTKVPQGALDAINEALEDAVADLSVTKTAYNATVAAKEDMMDKVAESIKEESDYAAAYYNMYTAAVDYAETAEGEYQNRVARAIVGISGDSLTWQGTQVTITKNDITSLKSAISDAKSALTAIKNSSDYSAAQVTALNKAIAAAQDVIDIYNGTEDAGINKVDTTKVGDKDEIVVSDITDAIAAIDSAINYSAVVMGWSKNSDGAWQYGEADGYVQSGWKQINSVWYYFENGVALQSTWKQIDGKWYYLNSNCGAAYGWAKVDGSWYYFGGDNAMKTGWVKVDGSWYYLNAGGKMVTGWAEVNGTWYYFSKESNALGQMLANTTTPDGYTVDANGALVD
jgi:glucan-binding YG repeat protein